MKNQIRRLVYLQRQLSVVIEEWIELALREKDLKLDELREMLMSRIDDAIRALKEGR